MPLLLLDRAHAIGGGIERLHVAFGFVMRADIALFLFEPDKLDRKGHWAGRRIGAGAQPDIDCPVFLLFESVDFFFALADQPQGDRLHPSCAEARSHFLPQKRRDHVPDEPVEDAPCLLGLIKLSVEFVRLYEGFHDRLARKLVEKNSSNRFFRVADLFGDMPGDRLSFPVRIGPQIDGIGPRGGLSEFLDYFLLPAQDLVLRFEFPIEVDSQLIAGKVLDMADAGFNDEVLAQIALEGPRLGGRFDNQKRFRHSKDYLT